MATEQAAITRAQLLMVILPVYAPAVLFRSKVKAAEVWDLQQGKRVY